MSETDDRPNWLGLLGLGVALILAGGVFDAEPLYPPGVALAAIALAARAWVGLAALGASVSREVPERRVEEERALPVVLDLEPGRVPAPGGRIVDDLLPDGLPVGRRRRARLSVRFSRRGRRLFAPPVMEVADPLGLARARIAGGDGGGELLVLPAVRPVRVVDGDSGGSRGSTALLAAAAATEMDGLRPYREGAPASRIHWPALARGAGLLERHLKAESDSRPLVVLDARGAASSEDLDSAVRATASLVHALAAAGGCAVLLPGDRRATMVEGDLGAWPTLHARLAVVPEDAAPARPAAGPVRRGQVVFVSARTVDRLPPALAALARGAQTLVVPGVLPGRSPVFEVGGCRGYALGAARTASARGGSA